MSRQNPRVPKQGPKVFLPESDDRSTTVPMYQDGRRIGSVRVNTIPPVRELTNDEYGGPPAEAPSTDEAEMLRGVLERFTGDDVYPAFLREIAKEALRRSPALRAALGAPREGGFPGQDAPLWSALWHVISGWSGHDEKDDKYEGCPCVERDADDDECTCGYSPAMRKIHELWRARSSGDAAPPEPSKLEAIAPLLPYIRHDVGCRSDEMEGCGPCTCGLQNAHTEYAKGASPRLDPEPKCSTCGGKGWLECDDPQCGDSTWDHECNAGADCPKCRPRLDPAGGEK